MGMLGQATRNRVRGICTALAKPFAALGISPNQVSLLGVVFALVAVAFILQGRYLLAFLFAVLAASMDLVDGSVAKLLNQRSPFGNYFDALMDKFVELFLYAAFAPRFPLETALAIGLSFIASYAKPRAGLVIVTDNRDWPGIGEHAERLLVFLLGLLASAFVPSLAGFKPMQLALGLIAVLALAGCLQRMEFAKKLIQEAEAKGALLPYLKEGRERE